MDTLNFLQRVLPSEGFFVTTVINPDGNKQGFFSTVEELAKAVIGLDQRGNNTYFAISSFLEKGSRKQENVRLTKVLVLDVDCGENKPFPSWKEGLKALGKFISDVGLPKPLIVHSGNGLHVYWVLDRELAPEEWKPLAEALKAATVAKGFDVDAGLTANSALVLRPIGTHNPKNGNEVKVLLDAEPTTVAKMHVALADHFVSHRRHTTGSKLAQALNVDSTLPPANAVVVAAKCQQIGWAIKNQKDVSEPMWYSLLGVAAYTTDPEATAIAWSEQHPAFDPDETMRKLEQWKRVTTGPATCAKFSTDRPDGCKGCKFKDKIGSPVRLGIQYQEVAAAADAIDPTSTEIPVPKPYKRTADGIKLTIDDTDIDVCKFDIYPVAYGRDETLGYETVRYHWKRPHVGWQELVMRQAYLTEGSREFPIAIADQGIVLNGKHQTGYFQHMLRAYMDELRQRRTMTNLYSTMGWKENFNQFVIGDTIIRRDADGSVSEDSITLASINGKLGHDLYGTSGTLQGWVDFTKLVEKARLDTHMFALCVSLSSPLYAFTGLKGLTISLYGPTGGGKTLAQLWMQSVWGNPDKLHFAAKFTQNTLFSRMGLYSNMPMTIDEATMMQDKDVGDFLYWVSQGRDKARLNRNAEERDAKTFAMPVTVSTNKSMASKLISSGLDTDAQMARLLEVSVRPSLLFTKDSEAGRKINDFVLANHGYAGREFVKKLLELGPSACRSIIADAGASFNSRYKCKFSGEERYWEQALILADLAGRLATDWGLIKFDHVKGIEWVLAQMGSIRRTVAENKSDAFDILGEYLNETASSALTVFHQENQKPTVDFSRVPRSSIHVRFDLYRKTVGDHFDRGVVMLDRTHFRKWMASRGADYKTFIQELTDESVIATPKSQKAYLGKDSPIKLGQTYVVGVNLNHPRLQGILDKESQNVDDLAFGQLRAIAQE
jgi:hypothetical protein